MHLGHIGCRFLILFHDALIDDLVFLHQALMLAEILDILKTITVHLLGQVVDQLDQALVDLQPEFFCVAPRGDEFVRQAVKAADADYLLAEEDGAVVGFALVNYAGWTPEFSCVLPHRYACLADLVVDEAHRQQGIGSTLLGAAKRWARDRRLEYLELSVLSQNAPAIALYESHDFVEATRVMRCML